MLTRSGYRHVEGGIKKMADKLYIKSMNPYAPFRNAPYAATTYPPAPTPISLAANQTVRVTSAYRNPERNERVSGARASKHMLGRALDISVYNIKGYGTQDRGAAFYKVWQVMHGANPGDAGYNNISIPNVPTIAQASPTVPWADRWALETGGAKDILTSNDSWVKTKYDKVKKKNVPTNYEIDFNKTGVLDGYEFAGHLHIQDNPNAGDHK